MRTSADLTHSKILVVGTSGCGKSTLARKLAALLHLADIELDALFWGPDWTGAEPALFRERLERAMSTRTGWIVHGNYSSVRDLTWGNADLVIWLDYSLPVVFWRVLSRSLSRIMNNEVLWAGNRETFRATFFSRRSVIWWSLKTYRLRKRQYEDLLRTRRYRHVRVLRFRNPRETDLFLKHFE